MLLGSAEKPEHLYLGGAEPIRQTRPSKPIYAHFQHVVDSWCLSDHSHFLLSSKLSFCCIYLFAGKYVKTEAGRGHSFTLYDSDYDFNGSSHTTLCTMRSCLQCLLHVSLMHERREGNGCREKYFQYNVFDLTE